MSTDTDRLAKAMLSQAQADHDAGRLPPVRNSSPPSVALPKQTLAAPPVRRVPRQLEGFEDNDSGSDGDELPRRKRSTTRLKMPPSPGYKEEMAAIAEGSNGHGRDHGSCCSMYGALFDALCCCAAPKGQRYDANREAIMKAPRWKLAWIVLLCACWVPIVAGAVYAHDHREAPQLAWYWFVPLSLAALAVAFTLPDGFHVRLARSHWASYGRTDSYQSAYDDSAHLRSWQSLLAVCITLCSIGSLITTFMFAWRDYWDELLSDGSPVDSLPAWLGILSTLLALAALACRLREVYLWDVRDARELDQENGLADGP